MSAPVSVTVIDPTNPLPTISITSPASTTAAAGVANVEFFQDGISLGQDTTAPFTILASSVPTGNYSLTAIITDKNGAKATAAPVDISVGNAALDTVRPRVVISSPAAGARVTTSDAILRGTASDNAAEAEVLYSLNGTSFREVEGSTTWEASIALLPGDNVVQVKSVDSSGNESDTVSRTFTSIRAAAKKDWVFQG